MRETRPSRANDVHIKNACKEINQADPVALGTMRYPRELESHFLHRRRNPPRPRHPGPFPSVGAHCTRALASPHNNLPRLSASGSGSLGSNTMLACPSYMLYATVVRVTQPCDGVDYTAVHNPMP